MVDLHKHTYAKFSRELEITVAILALAAVAGVYNAIVGPPQRALIMQTDEGFLYTNGRWIQHMYAPRESYLDDFIGEIEETEIRVWDLSEAVDGRARRARATTRGN